MTAIQRSATAGIPPGSNTVRLHVPLVGHSYEVLVGSGLLANAAPAVRAHLHVGHCGVISDEKVASRFAQSVIESFEKADMRSTLLTVPSGEESKSLAQVGAVCERMASAGLDRSSFVVALGGGVVGDLAGFVAAIYHRGIPWVNIPTTLLAMVDSSIGGKTAVNTPAGKNLIGAWHHPVLVISDVDTLDTLPPREWKQGFAEIIKHAIIRDAELLDSLAEVDRGNAEAFVERNLAIKAAIVAADEREQKNTRALLNFGHTIGHAIEYAAGYGRFLHGEAISLGIVAATQVSVRRAGLSLGEAAKIGAALQAHHLPITLPPDFPRDKIFAALSRDKKFESGRIRFVVAHAIGRASLSEEVTMEDLRAAIAEL